MKDLLRELEALDEADLVARIAACDELTSMQKALWVLQIKGAREMGQVLVEHKKREEDWQRNMLDLIAGEELDNGARGPGLKDLVPLIGGLEKMAKAYEDVKRFKGAVLVLLGIGASWWVYASSATKELKLFLIKLLS